MRSIRDTAHPPCKPGASVEPANPDASDARTEQIDRLVRELAACEKLDDAELARRTGRALLAVIACAADALLADGGQALQGAPDKFGAFFDKAAAGYVQAIDGLAKRADLAQQAAGNGFAAARNVADPPLPAYPAWQAAARE